MTSRGKPREPQPARPLSNRAIALGAVIVLGIGAVAWTVLLWRYGGADPGVELDAIRTAGTLIVGTGGFAALLLAARRQRSTELTLEHERENAAEQRITELYTRAVGQLGNDQAPVRLGGLHALERLAQNNPIQRQTIVDVICAYLRMPYTPPQDHAPGKEASEQEHRLYEQRRQELQVRLTAQRILTAHLNPIVKVVFWADIDLDLTEAHLHQLDLTTCHVHSARFDRATFTGNATFREAHFVGDAVFSEATFDGPADFSKATFTGNAGFGKATFAGNVLFREVKFAGEAGFFGEAVFSEVKFAGFAQFSVAQFAAIAEFSGAEFAESAEFGGAQFAGEAWFKEARFAGEAGFKNAQFAENAWFSRAKFAGTARFNGSKFAARATLGQAKFARNTAFAGARMAPSVPLISLPTGWTTRAAQSTESEEEGWLYVVRDEESSEQPTGADDGGSDQV